MKAKQLNEFWKLLQKDWRVNRVIVIVLLILMVLPYGLWSTAYAWDSRAGTTKPLHPARFESTPDELDLGSPLGNYIRIAAVTGIMFAVLAAAVFGAAAFAIERRERSADFLAMLPVKRSKIIASKLLLATAVLSGALAIEVGVLLFSDLHRQWESLPELCVTVFHYVASGVLIFGIAWLFSTFLSSTAIAASVAIALAGSVSLLYGIFLRRPDSVPVWLGMVMGIVCGMGIILIISGSMYYLRRVAP